MIPDPDLGRVDEILAAAAMMGMPISSDQISIANELKLMSRRPFQISCRTAQRDILLLMRTDGTLQDISHNEIS